MFWLILGFVGFIIAVFRIFFDDLNFLGEKFLLSFIALLLSIVITIAILLIASCATTCCSDINYNVVSDTKIIALKDNQNVNGNFYIMGGYVDEDLYYYYATETEFGYKTEKIKADNAYIKYANGEPHIEKLEGKFTNENAYFWGFPMCEDRYIIYCPEGTVTNEFNVDLE